MAKQKKELKVEEPKVVEPKAEAPMAEELVVEPKAEAPVAEPKAEEKAPIAPIAVVGNPVYTKAQFKDLIEAYKIQNPAKYELKKEALKEQLNLLK